MCVEFFVFEKGLSRLVYSFFFYLTEMTHSYPTLFEKKNATENATVATRVKIIARFLDAKLTHLFSEIRTSINAESNIPHIDDNDLHEVFP